jgi:hypothetical protein
MFVCAYMAIHILTHQRYANMLRPGTSLFSAKYHVDTRNSCYLRTYFLLVPYYFPSLADQAQGIQNRNLVGILFVFFLYV